MLFVCIRLICVIRGVFFLDILQNLLYNEFIVPFF